MTMTGGALAPLLTISPDKDTSLAPAHDDTGMTAQPVRAGSCPPNSYSCTAPTAKIRHALRALASESDPGKRLNSVAQRHRKQLPASAAAGGRPPHQ